MGPPAKSAAGCATLYAALLAGFMIVTGRAIDLFIAVPIAWITTFVVLLIGLWLAVLMDDGGFAWVSGSPKYVTIEYVYPDEMTLRGWRDGVERFLSASSKPTPRPTVSLRPTPTRELPVTPRSICQCLYNAYNCGDFPTQATAQACFNYCWNVVGSDVHWLDEDGDRIACEWNP